MASIVTFAQSKFLGIFLPIAAGAFIAGVVALMLGTLSAGMIILVFAAALVVLPTFVVRNVKLYWLGLFVITLPLNIKKQFLLDLATAKTLRVAYGLPPGAMPAPVLFVSDIVFIILLALWIAHLVEKREPISTSRIFWVAIAYLGWSALSISVAPMESFAFYELVNQIKYVVVFLYFANAISSQQEVRYLVILLVLGMALQGVISVSQYANESLADPFGNLFSSAYTDVEREKSHLTVEGTDSGTQYRYTATVGFNHPNRQGQYYALLLPLSFCLIWTCHRIWEKGLWSCAFILGIIGLILTASRGGAAAVLASFLTLVALGVFRKLIPLSLVMWGTLFLLLSVPWAYSYLSSRPHYITSRFHLWEVGLPIVYDHPILGVGLNNSVIVGFAYDDPWRVFWGFPFHNFYLTTAVEIGLVGLLLFIAAFASAAWCAFRSFITGEDNRLQNWLSIVIPATFAGIAIHLGVDQLSGEVNSTLLWMMAGLALALLNLARPSQTATDRSK